jgi:hypothetical protein
MRCLFLLFALAAAVVAGMGCAKIRAEQATATKEPAAVSSTSTASQKSAAQAKPTAQKKDEPLLLLGNGPEDKPSTGPVADNSRCHVCHLNFEQEEMALTHARANIGCAKCHGPSDAHIADESWASGGNGTAPDIMFLPDKINPACMECHPREKLIAETRCLFLAAASDKKYCTDCHGKHRMASRRCKWK